jgi:hypothetical protein
MCPSGQATIRTGCTPDQESGAAWGEDRWGEMLLLEDFKQRSVKQTETWVFTGEPACVWIVVSGAIIRCLWISGNHRGNVFGRIFNPSRLSSLQSPRARAGGCDW